MRPFTKLYTVIFTGLIFSSCLTFAKGLDVRALTALDSINEAVVSPNGEHVIYSVKKISDGNSSSNLYLQSLSATTEQITQLTNHPLTERNVVWGNDNKSVYFVSKRGGSNQVWRLPLTGGEAIQVSDVPLAIEGFKLSADNKLMLLSMSVFNDCPTLACNASKFAAISDNANAGKVYDQLMVRHWDTWNNGSYKHLFVATLADDKLTNMVDITKGLATDVPAKPFAGMEQVTFSPDNKAVVYSAKAPSNKQASHTNFDLWQVNIDGSDLKNLTANNKAWDAAPIFSNDGRYMAYTAMSKPGAESDRFAIMLKDLVTGSIKEVAPLWDRSVREMMFAPDSRNIVVTAQDLGQVSVFIINIQFGDIKQILNQGSASLIGVNANNVIIKKKSLDNPGQLYALSFDGIHSQQLTQVNHAKLKTITFGEYEQFSFKGWQDETVYGYWVKPSNFDADKKYPIAFLIHGGPQGSFGNSFSTRWNPQLWADAGYGVVMIDFHGSTGYGQKFTESINQDWGGKPLIDLQKGLAAVVQQQPWLDGDRACALGASYGGYMINWIAGNWPDQFKCLVNHAGLFDLRMFYNVTEELWFPQYDFSGSYQSNPQHYEKFNPVNLVDKWKTPMLLIHGEKDFRVPYGQSLAAFTVLQKNNIDSKLLIFPDENHWISTPKNKTQWYDNVIDWMNKHTNN